MYLQLPALFAMPDRESMQEFKLSVLLVVMAISHAMLTTPGI